LSTRRQTNRPENKLVVVVVVDLRRGKRKEEGLKREL
jgi:hypothetical protein